MAKQHAKRRDPVSFVLRLLVRASACIATGALVALVGYVLIQGAAVYEAQPVRLDLYFG